MPRPVRLLVTVAVMGGIFVSALDTTIVAAAMPTIADDLGGLDLYAWAFALYIVASTATVPLYGRLADWSGRKRLYLLAVGLFLLGSLLCGLAPSMPVLLGARLVQGLGAGGILPLALTVAGDLYGPGERARIQGLFSSVWAVAAVLGPLVGGGIVDHVGWRWIFLLNVPFGLASAGLLQRFLVEAPREGAPGRPDFGGAIVLTAALGALLVSLLEAGKTAWLEAGLALAAAAGLGALFLRQERAAESPLVDTGLLRIRIVATSNAVGFLSGALLFAVAAYVPFWVQRVQGGTATRAGLALTPMSIGWLAGAYLVGRLLPRLGYRAPTVLGLAVLAGASVSLALLRESSPAWRVLAPMAAIGLGLGFAFTATLVAVQNAVSRGRLGQATSSVHLFRSVGGVLGVSLAGCVQVATLRARGVAPEEASVEALAGSLTATFATLAAFAASALVAGLFLPRGMILVSEEARLDQEGIEEAPVDPERVEEVWRWPDGGPG